ncbi:MAG: DNA-formamidopyrimidine glycosylase [Candidatus Fraserbacteria bacterium RBG_16_55_9]|uniref:Formamidopyrimidine-DNA glycosylase n=1 Tax=Fraserbacteria sp. (strain RBG_16_55_9) TaxID=1817864 RepID=A0A1F5V2G8_FRAXR|nr:MAG: DNA-formamidopyrimidine glycosylase [Candidatus Fraserbacteria bacterium RBG_16_55_9]
MPELVEVETIRRSLEREIVGLTLQDIDVKERVHLLKNCSLSQLKRCLTGWQLMTVMRRGKYLIFDFGRYSMILHLRMSGRLLLQPARHTRLVLDFDEKKLFFDDARRFGMLYLSESSQLEELKPLKELGIEPLSLGYTLGAFRQKLRTREEIKRSLLDQRKIAGLGNIYANEALFEARIHPKRQANSLSPQESRRLFQAIPLILGRALEAGGTSIDSYRTPQGELGRFQEDFSVYERAGRPCRRCLASVKRIAHGGRSSYFCPKCQPLGM